MPILYNMLLKASSIVDKEVISRILDLEGYAGILK